MPPITALLHTENDALRLGRALETLYPCDDILVIDHGSRDGSAHVAREYGARVVIAKPGVSPDYYLQFASPEFANPGSPSSRWILHLDPRESLTENLAASLFEWKSLTANAASSSVFSVFLREETSQGWMDVPAPQTRLVPHDWNRWNGRFPIQDPSALALEGELLRFVFP